MEDLQAQLQAVAAEMAQLGVAGQASAALALANSPYNTYAPGATTGTVSPTNTAADMAASINYGAAVSGPPDPSQVTLNPNAAGITVNQTNNINGSTAPSDITTATTNAILFGTTQALVKTGGGKGSIAS
jgi:hypothetical protein